MKFPRVMIADLPKGYKDKYPWEDGQAVLIVGEIENMPGHCIVVDRAGKVSWGYHTDGFREPTEDEL